MPFLSRFVESAFFEPESRRYWHPAHFGLKYDEFRARTPEGGAVAGFLLRAAGKYAENPRGTVLYCHSGRQNLSFNLPQAAFLCEGGFDVLAFDPQGFGDSTGEASLSSLGSDAAAALSWLDGTPRRAAKVALFGQFAGCDAALQLAALKPERIAGAVLESCYASRRGWVQGHWGPLLGTALARTLSVSAPEPADVLRGLHVPLALVFPARDAVIRSAQSRALKSAAPAQAECWEAKGAPFLGVFAGRDGRWREAMLRFLERKCFAGKGEKKKEKPGKN
jgi:pimeloyl-ACP methyl ester carboxylesterase